MARILIATQPIAGHVAPTAPVVQELARRGHEVRWYTGRKYARAAQAAGAGWEPFVHARDYDDSAFGNTFTGRDDRRGVRQLQFDVQHVFVGQIEGQLQDLRDVARSWPHALVLADQTVAAALLHEELGGPPCALLGVLPLGIRSEDAAPFGLGLPPSATPVGRWRNRILNALLPHAVFGAASRDLSDVCGRLGLPARPFEPPVAPTLMLQPSVPEFEYVRGDLPSQLKFIGPLLPAPGARPLPDWWADVQRDPRPLIVVTQGTLATDPTRLIWPALCALADEDVQVVVAGAHPQALPGPLPRNARATPFLPFARALPEAALYVTNGGYGGVMQALLHGLPCLVAGRSEDKAEVAARVAHAGVGMNLGTDRPTPVRIRRAARALLRDPAYRTRARLLAEQLAAHDAPREAADLLEGLLPKDHHAHQ
ncbi:glycosyltransferase [Deinococcus sedimenti]|uniref:Glycosyl transferase n=1 Tax=Deinococcus sedimenti TaxID=1867090 RepID=A0ABQ2S3R8_9DEIO|nr:nucleotide disphospho-sugar-binding domain-containing protein [Deinococcus sedimenti]GGR93422.1 glycosyl transferase [Deinococcus sedimenti]